MPLGLDLLSVVQVTMPIRLEIMLSDFLRQPQILILLAKPIFNSTNCKKLLKSGQPNAQPKLSTRNKKSI